MGLFPETLGGRAYGFSSSLLYQLWADCLPTLILVDLICKRRNIRWVNLCRHLLSSVPSACVRSGNERLAPCLSVESGSRTVSYPAQQGEAGVQTKLAPT